MKEKQLLIKFGISILKVKYMTTLMSLGLGYSVGQTNIQPNLSDFTFHIILNLNIRLNYQTLLDIESQSQELLNSLRLD